MPAPRVYLAGPEVFLPDGAAVGDAKRALCAAAGLVGVFPLDAEAGLGEGALGGVTGFLSSDFEDTATLSTASPPECVSKYDNCPTCNCCICCDS